MEKKDYAEYAMELADKILDLATDLKRVTTLQAREDRARSARSGFRLLGGRRAAVSDRPAELAESLDGEHELVSTEAEK